MKNLNVDTRTLPVKSANLRAVANADGTTTVEGRAIVFNQPSQPLPFVEYISPHALDDVDFSKTLLLYGHDFNQILARADAGSLSVNIDDKGLTFKATLPDTTLAHDTRENINSGNVQGCSFGFKIADGGDSWDTADDGTAIHYVNKIETVDELTLTPIPAYTQTSVQVQRSLDKLINKEERENMNSSNASSATSASAASSTATSSAALTASDVAAAITAAIKPLSSAVSSLVDRQCHNDSSDDRAAKRDDEDVESVDDSNDADLGVDDDETDSKRDSAADSSATSSDSDGCQRSSAASSSTSSAATSSSAISSAASSSSASDSTRSINPQNNKEDNEDMLDITNNKKTQDQEILRDFAHYLVTREMRPSLQRDAAAQGIGLTQGSVLIPETILAAMHEEHQYPRLHDYVHAVSVTTTTGKQPYFEENTGVLQTKEEFNHAADVSLSGLKFINWDLKTYAGKLAISRDVLMDSEKGSSENWLSEAQSQMRDLQDNTNDSLISAQLQNGVTPKNATDAVADMKTVLNVNLKPQDSANAQIVLTQSAYNALDQLKDGIGRPLLQPDPTAKTSNLLFGKPVVVVDDTLFGKAGDAVAVIAPLNKVIYDFQMGQVSGQFIDNFDIFDTTLGVFIRKDVVNGRPDLVNILKLTDKSLAASNVSTSVGK